MSGFGNTLDTHFLSEAHSYGVDALCESALQCHGVAREVAVGIGRCPCHLFLLLLVPHLHGEILIATLITRCESLVHGFRVDEEFER